MPEQTNGWACEAHAANCFYVDSSFLNIIYNFGLFCWTNRVT